jgi:hypothetical protein
MLRVRYWDFVPGYAPVTGAIPLDVLRRAFAEVVDSRAPRP